MRSATRSTTASTEAVVYLTSEQFTNEVISSIATARMGEFRNKYGTVDVLLIETSSSFGKGQDEGGVFTPSMPSMRSTSRSSSVDLSS